MNLRVAHSPASHSAILHERGWRRYQAHSPAGALSIKCMFGGAAHYQTRLGRHRVDDGRYLILNRGTPYTITIDQPQRIESFCIFFAPGLVEAALHARVTQADQLLDDPARHPPALSFFEHTYPHDHTLTPALLRLRRASARHRHDSAWWDEQLHTLAGCLLRAHRNAQREAARLPATRPATRAELYRRLHRARDYMEACLADPLTLAARQYNPNPIRAARKQR